MFLGDAVVKVYNEWAMGMKKPGSRWFDAMSQSLVR